ncbi:hypothetical protein AWQ21_11035 [Picosynechococcus sp. PCC 7003]|nr:hypothetical protein AWQ21_11035 [Picosynechococcus sp. PCC 7003]
MTLPKSRPILRSLLCAMASTPFATIAAAMEVTSVRVDKSLEQVSSPPAAPEVKAVTPPVENPTVVQNPVSEPLPSPQLIARVPTAPTKNTPQSAPESLPKEQLVAQIPTTGGSGAPAPGLSSAELIQLAQLLSQLGDLSVLQEQLSNIQQELSEIRSVVRDLQQESVINSQERPRLPEPVQQLDSVATNQENSRPVTTSPQTANTESSPETESDVAQIPVPPPEREETPEPGTDDFLQKMPLNRVNPLITTQNLDGTPISHFSDWEIAASGLVSDSTTSDVNVDGFARLDSDIFQGTTADNVAVTDFRGTYVRLRSAPQDREVETDIDQPVTLGGYLYQFTLTGGCDILDPGGGGSDETCSFLPPVAFDPQSYDPDTLLPGRLLDSGIPFGGVVSEENLAFIKQPGFQRGLPGQEVGIELNVPNSGIVAIGPETGRQGQTIRRENLDNTYSVGLSNVRQVLKQNDQEAVLGRTVRGFAAIPNDEDFGLDSAVQLATLLLPDVDPALEGGDAPPNPNVNANLFTAANNSRLPSNSFTAYQGSVSRAESITDLNTPPEDIPAATSNSFWVGLSPVVDREIEILEDGSRFKDFSGPRLVAAAYGEGGAEVADNLSAQVAATLLNEVGGVDQQLLLDFDDIQNAYTQIGLAFFERDATQIIKTRYRERTNYVPHLSFTGNRTDNRNRTRYYLGALIDYTAEDTQDWLKAYVGGDYRYRNVNSGVQAEVGGIGYLNPDKDYYSRLWGNVAKTFSADNGNSFTLAAGLDYAIDQDQQIGDIFVGSTGSRATISAAARLGGMTLSADQNFGGLLPNSDESSLTLRVGTQLGENFSLSGYYTPFDEDTVVARYGVNAGIKFGSFYNSPSLVFGWSQDEYKFATGTFSDDRFTVSFSTGQPNAPFVTGTRRR